MIQARFLRLGSLLLLGLDRAAAQDIPMYPPPEPLDTAGLGRTDGQTFANSQVVGMGPSKGLIVKYERILGNFSLRSTAVGGVEAGYRYNYQLNAFDRTDSTRDRIIDNQLGGMPYTSLDLFIVPPKKLLQKAERRRKQAISTA